MKRPHRAPRFLREWRYRRLERRNPWAARLVRLSEGLE